MKGRLPHKKAFSLTAITVLAAAGVRFETTGQGYSDPKILPVGGNASLPASNRRLEVRLTNRETGRPQFYQWSLSMPLGGAVEIECHEWRQMYFFGHPTVGWPRNSFLHTIVCDVEEEGIVGPYHFELRWKKMPDQTPQATAGRPAPDRV